MLLGVSENMEQIPTEKHLGVTDSYNCMDTVFMQLFIEGFPSKCFTNYKKNKKTNPNTTVIKDTMLFHVTTYF